MKRYDRQSTRQYHTGGKTWRAIREKVILRDASTCQACGRVVANGHVDHRDNNSHNNELSNLAYLCAHCHGEKTKAEQGGRQWTRKGCDSDGWPVGT